MTVHPYIPNTAPAVKDRMLAFVGAQSTEDFYADVPAELHLDRLLDLPEPYLAEQDLEAHLQELIGRNADPAQRLRFLGAGCYRHYVPAVVEEVINRSEFLTAYAGEPYEDHGRFQALFEYESLLAELLDVEVVTVPTYDGFQATASALAVAARRTGRSAVIMASDVLADKLSRIRDFLPGVELINCPTANGTADVNAVRELLDDRIAAVWVETPSATGAVEPAIAELAGLAHAAGALLVAGCDPIGLGVLAPPAAQGADITCGELQSLGLRPWLGGAHGGFLGLANDPALIAELPSRIFGLAPTEVPGEYGFGDIAFDRTSLGSREEGIEWVGTAAALWGIAAGVYLSLMGPQGMAELGRTLLARTRYAERKLGAIDGIRLVDDALHLREFVLDLTTSGSTSEELVQRLRRDGIEPGVAIDDHRLLVCVTELTGQADIDRLAESLTAAITLVRQEHIA